MHSIMRIHNHGKQFSKMEESGNENEKPYCNVLRTQHLTKFQD